MGLVTRCTVLDDPFAGPMGDAFAVRAAHPILFLSKMTLAAKLVRVVHIDFHTRFRFKKITRILFMACKTGQRSFRTAMIQDDNTVGHLGSPFDGNGFIVVTLSALKPLHFILSSFRPEGVSPVPGLYENHAIRHRERRVDVLSIIKWRNSIFVNLCHASFSGVYGPPLKDDEQGGQSADEAGFKCRCLHSFLGPL